MIHNKIKLIEDLTGVRSSKLNYYGELKKRNKEILLQNRRLEIIHQLSRHISIDTPLEAIIPRIYESLSLVIPCDFLGVLMPDADELRWIAAPAIPYCMDLLGPARAARFVWEIINKEQKQVFLCPVVRQTRNVPIKDLRLRCLILNPLWVKTNIVGVLVIGAQQSNAYSQSDLEFATQLADQVAICIQNRRLFEEAIRAKGQWEQTFRALADPILLIDSEFNILLDNGRFGSIANVDKSAKNEKCYRYLWGLEQKCEPCLMEDVFTSRKAAYQRIQSRGGQVLDIFYYPVFDDKDRLYGGILHIKDVTKKVQLEAQLVESAKLAAIGEMAAGVAHELNSPLTVIIGNAQMLQRQFGAEHSASYLLKDIVTCGLRCKRIIQNLLTFARQEPPVVGPVDLNDAVERVLGLIGYQIKRYGITMYTEFAADLPRVWGDAHQLEQVLINLLLNARDALETVGREKYIRVATGMREAADGRRYATVIVEDNGEGIAAENVSKIFNPFFTTKEAVRGSGLGLSVSLGIAQAHGGTIEVESRFGEGSIFTLVLPLDRDDR